MRLADLGALLIALLLVLLVMAMCWIELQVRVSCAR
jgi:hypothetical protein